jgi:hypothetical protein
MTLCALEYLMKAPLQIDAMVDVRKSVDVTNLVS